MDRIGKSLEILQAEKRFYMHQGSISGVDVCLCHGEPSGDRDPNLYFFERELDCEKEKGIKSAEFCGLCVLEPV